MSARPKLRELADRLGIVGEYTNMTGHRVRTSDATRERILAIMGFEAPTEDAARGWLAELDHEEADRIIAPVRVVERDDPSAKKVHVELPTGVRSADVALTLIEEAGHVWKVKKELRGSGTLLLPTRVPYGYHQLTVRVQTASGEWNRDQSLIVVPSKCVTPTMLGNSRGVGVVANLYSVRREHDWGIGDATTLMQLVEWAASRGATFVGVNPLHALFNRGVDISPYSPVSRLFRNHIYIDVESVPEWPNSETARALPESKSMKKALRDLRGTKQVDYDHVIALKERVLDELYRTFRDSASEGELQRWHEFEDFEKLREPELTRFGTWMAIAESAGIPDWRRWPEALRDPQAPMVREFENRHRDRIDFYRWLQFEMHRQLHGVAQRARVLGMDVGVYQDLAIGTSPGGSDTWSYPELFITGASVGAPPDPYSATGQTWGLLPIDPRALRNQRYRYWIQLLRRAFEHTGALRIDHVMGLFRSFWIPDGGTGKDGAYVRLPAADLLGILALESVRHDALVVGEDLGTVPEEVPPALKKWGILSSKVLYFELDKRGFKPAKRYPRLALVTANTHDLPTIAGFWTERDIELRARVGLLRTPKEVRRAKRARGAEKRALLRLLKLSRPPRFEESHFPRKLTAAIHEFLCSTPADLVGLSLDDLIGEVDPVNVPGVGPDKYPSWRRRTRMTIEEVGWSFEVDEAIRCKTRRRVKR